jgi:hypothetical protein
MNIMTKKQMSVGRHAVGQALVFILSCGYLAGCTALELESITYQEAVTQYQEGGGIENYRCALVPADEQYQALKDAQPIAVEIDESLFVKIDGTVHELQQTEIEATLTAYAYEDMSATLITLSQFNHSEYGESDDRHVDLAFESAGNQQTYKTFGAACGL